MPVKHIPDKTWNKVQDEYVKAVGITKGEVKMVEVLNLLILKGITTIRKEDYEKLKKE